MRGRVRSGSRIVEDAQIRRAALIAATHADVFLKEYGDDARLLRRLTTTQRLEGRLFERLASSHGDPAATDWDIRRYLSYSESRRQLAAVCAGLTYHLNAIGPALSREVIKKLKTSFGRKAVQFAVSHAALSPPTVAVMDTDLPETERIVRADGGHILSLWALHNGLAALWRPPIDGMDAPASVGLVKHAAIEIGAAIVRSSEGIER